MYQNKVNLIGFLGGNAEVRNANNRSFTTLSLATKSSYKDKKSGQYVAQTEWHRCVRPLASSPGFHRNTDQRRPCPARRRAPQPRNSGQEFRLQAAHLGNPRRLHPEARPG